MVAALAAALPGITVRPDLPPDLTPVLPLVQVHLLTTRYEYRPWNGTRPLHTIPRFDFDAMALTKAQASDTATALVSALFSLHGTRNQFGRILSVSDVLGPEQRGDWNTSVRRYGALASLSTRPT